MNKLTDMMRKAPLNRQTVEQYRNQALQVVDNAIDVFFKPEREVAEGKAAYDQLTDLERSLRAYTQRVGGESRGMVEAFHTAQREKGKLKPSQGEVGATASLLPEGRALKNGFREVGYAGPTHEPLPSLDRPLDAVTHLAHQMNSVLPLYGSVAMVPGPLSVSLKDHLKETLQWSAQGQSSSQSHAETETFRLLTLSAGKKRVSSSSVASSSEKGQATTTTADERVMPGLHGIRNAVASLGYVEGQTRDYKVLQKITEYETSTRVEGFIFKEKVKDFKKVNEGQLTIAQGTLPVLPEHMQLGALGTNAGLEQPRAGSELVDLVDRSELTPEFLDEFRDGAAVLLDSAVSTLFNTTREVGEGREAYDKLTNLGRALSLAQSKWGTQDYDGGIGPLIGQLEEVTPLYACVAMVPGEMSSSVKNHAKQLFEFQSSARSAAASQSHEWNVSLLGSLSETRGSSSESSERSASLRYETTTTDERIMPSIHELKVALDGLQISPKGKLVRGS